MRPLRIVFAGTPDFAATILAGLLQSHHRVVGVLTQPDRGAGRGKKVIHSPVKRRALEHGLPVLQPARLKDGTAQSELAELDADVLVVAAYGLIVPLPVLELPRFGCINVHASLLPRWRGAAPIQRAIMAGDSDTGTTIMKMDTGLDTGPMLAAQRLTIGSTETGGELHDRLAAQGSSLLLDVLSDLPGHLQQARPQPDDGATYAHKLSKKEARLDFRLPGRAVLCRIRAFNPWPVCWVDSDGQRLRIWQAAECSRATDAAPGTIVEVRDNALIVATGDGTVALIQLQLPGKRPMSVADIVRGHPQLLRVGMTLG